jgi:hypothetical protein
LLKNTIDWVTRVEKGAFARPTALANASDKLIEGRLTDTGAATQLDLVVASPIEATRRGCLKVCANGRESDQHEL